MAVTNSLFLFQLLLLTFLLALSSTFHPVISAFTAIFNFGDSISDTGNILYSPEGWPHHSGKLPYGETYFHRPTGRCSDGRLIVDFIAQRLGVPLLPPYLAGSSGQDFRRGVNFAVSGATALDADFFIEKGIDVKSTHYCLSTQVGWFKQLLPSLCSSDSSECDGMLSTSLFLMGEIGGNDYNHPFLKGRTLDEIQTFVPRVINSIICAINDLIELGARTLVVPGNFPIGCIPSYLTTFQSSTTEDYYDAQTGCINWLNEFSEEHHNRQLKQELERLRRLHPYANIIYADYYEAVMSIIRSPHKLGPNKVPLVACCGAGGPYNFNLLAFCGDQRATVCADPSKHVSWDGLHLTEAAYKTIAESLLDGTHATTPIASISGHMERIGYQPQQI